MYDLNSDNPNPVVNYDGIQKNVTSVGFHEEGKWMYTGGEDNTVRIWDLRSEPPPSPHTHITLLTDIHVDIENKQISGNAYSYIFLVDAYILIIFF